MSSFISTTRASSTSTSPTSAITPAQRLVHARLLPFLALVPRRLTPRLSLSTINQSTNSLDPCGQSVWRLHVGVRVQAGSLLDGERSISQSTPPLGASGFLSSMVADTHLPRLERNVYVVVRSCLWRGTRTVRLGTRLRRRSTKSGPVARQTHVRSIKYTSYRLGNISARCICSDPCRETRYRTGADRLRLPFTSTSVRLPSQDLLQSLASFRSPRKAVVTVSERLPPEEVHLISRKITFLILSMTSRAFKPRPFEFGARPDFAPRAHPARRPQRPCLSSSSPASPRHSRRPSRLLPPSSCSMWTTSTRSSTRSTLCTVRPALPCCPSLSPTLGSFPS